MINIKFCVATTEYWHSIGFDTTGWKKNIDGTKAIVHEEYANVLINTENNENIQVYECPSDELKTLLISSEWENT